MKHLAPVLVLLLLCACATNTSNPETMREMVLQYIGHDVGTLGPFSRQAKRELALLSNQDRVEALALMDRGAVGFLIIERDQTRQNRIVMFAKGRVVREFPAAKDEPGR